MSSGSGAYKNVCGIGRVGTAKIPPGGQEGRVFLVPDPSLHYVLQDLLIISQFITSLEFHKILDIIRFIFMIC